MKKELFIFTSLILGTVISHSQSVNWQWAKGTRDCNRPTSAEGRTVATDRNDNVYFGGYFGDSIAFGSGTFFSAGFDDIFLAKCDPVGHVLWAKTFGGNSNDHLYSVATDELNNVYFTGYFGSSSITFGGTILNSSGLGNPYTGDIYVVKCDSNGNVLWARCSYGGLGTGADGEGFGISVDKSYNVCVTGYFSGDSITFGAITLYSIGATGLPDIVVVKYDSSGNVLWAKNAGGRSVQEGRGIATDANGNIYITGVFNDTINIGSFTLQSAASEDIFIAKYDGQGNVLWARRAGGSDSDFGSSIAVDGSGNVCITGFFRSPSIIFGSDTLTNAKLSWYDVFIVKYDASGNLRWAKSAGGNYSDLGYSIATDAYGYVYVAGQFESDSITFDSITLLRPLIDTLLGSDSPMFIVSMDSNGKVLCASALASGGDDESAICFDKSGSAYVAGDYFMFYPYRLSIGPDTLPVNGGEAIFVAKFNCPGVVIEDVNSLTTNASLQVFPNPITAGFVAKYSLPINSKNAELVIFDLLGRRRGVYKLDDTGDQTIISSETFGSGIYFFSLVVDGKNVLTKRMVVE